MQVETTQYNNNNNSNNNKSNDNDNDNHDDKHVDNDDDDDDKLIKFLKGISPRALIASSFVLFSDQRPRSFWSARRIATSGRVQQGKSSIHGLPIQFDKSYQVRIRNESLCMIRKSGPGRGYDSWCGPKESWAFGTRMPLFSSHDEVLQNGTATRHVVIYILNAALIRSSYTDPTLFLYSLYMPCQDTSCQLVIATFSCFSLFLKVHV